MKSFSCNTTILPLLFVSSLFIQLVLVLHLGHASEVEHDVNHHHRVDPSDGLERQEDLVQAIKLELIPF